MNEMVSAYGLWPLVILNSAVFIFFAFSFIKPKTSLDWRGLGAFSAFIVALFAEMYGFPLTIYFLSGWLQAKFPETDLLHHDSGHLWHTVLGFEGNPHTNPIHIVSSLLIAAGFYVIFRGWQVLHEAQAGGNLATDGPYRYVRHPQYCGLIIVMFGFLVMWPTLLTLVMFPVLVVVYIQLAKKEERLVLKTFGDKYIEYTRTVPMFIPRLKHLTQIRP